MESDLIGVDCDNRARILKVRNPDPNCLTRFRFYNDELKDVLIPNMLGMTDKLSLVEAKEELQHFRKMMKKRTKFGLRNIFFHTILQKSLERFYFPIDVMALMKLQFRECILRQGYSDWEAAFYDKMTNKEVIDIKSMIENSGTSSSNLFMNVYNNRTREYNKDMLGVFKFMRNVGIHALDFPPAVSTFF